jgi:hypothetical protein
MQGESSTSEKFRKQFQCVSINELGGKAQIV